jgi:hypothetical protein
MFGVASIRSTLVPAFAGVAWLVAVASGFAALHRYASTPAHVGIVPSSWPGQDRMALEVDRLTLVVAIHPRCPCTRATAQALEELLASRPGRARLNALVYKPAQAPEKWAMSTSSQSLSALSDARSWIDLDGLLARKFGASTSGQVLAFDAHGCLRFSGGVTPVRGEVGPNAGYAALASLLDDKPAQQINFPVFGCSILPAPKGHGGKT